MIYHGLVAPILVILSKDKLKALSGFCRPKENHVCVPTYNIIVRTRVLGYNNIMDAFTNDKVGEFARVIMVYSLHANLLWLVLIVTLVVALIPCKKLIGTH
jgi:hypothetical protein